jgi:hypothetical protein
MLGRRQTGRSVPFRPLDPPGSRAHTPPFLLPPLLEKQFVQDTVEPREAGRLQLEVS